MQFLEERVVNLMRLETIEQLHSPRVGDMVFFMHDADSCGIVIGRSTKEYVYVAWSRRPSLKARLRHDLAVDIMKQIDLTLTSR